MLGRLGRHDCQKGVSVWSLGAPGKSIGSASVVPQFGVVNKAFVVIQPPIVRVIADSELFQCNSTFRHPCTVGWFRGEKTCSVIVGNDQVRIELSSDLQQGR